MTGNLSRWRSQMLEPMKILKSGNYPQIRQITGFSNNMSRISLEFRNFAGWYLRSSAIPSVCTLIIVTIKTLQALRMPNGRSKSQPNFLAKLSCKLKDVEYHSGTSEAKALLD
jgi:hypothetical protein